jgi:hypothetical protein
MTEKDITGGANNQLKLTYLLFHPRALWMQDANGMIGRTKVIDLDLQL